MPYQVIDPFLEFVNPANGQPISIGSVYFGRPDSDPKNQPSNRINVYAVQDNGTEVLLSQPIQLNAAGQPQYNGSPKQLKIALAGSDTSYCVQVFDKNGAQKLYTARVVPAVDVANLSAVDSTVSIGGVESGDIAKRSTAGFRTIEEFGGGVGVADNSAAWQALLDSGASWAHFGGVGNYVFKSACTHNQNIKITASEKAVIDCTQMVAGSQYWTKFSGSKTALPDLSASALIGDYQLTFASAPPLQAGDVFIIFNPAPSSWSAFRAVYYAGEFCRVAFVSGNTVTLASPLYDSYSAAAVDLYKVNPIQVDIDNMNIVGSTSTSLLDIEFGIACNISNININHKNNSTIQLIRCYGSNVTNPYVYNAGQGTLDDYGIVVTNSQCVKVIGGSVYARRHGITTGGDGEVCAVPCRELLFDGVTISNDPRSDVFAADFHGNTEGSMYVNCTIYGGATWQGKNNGYKNCDIYSMKNGVCIYSSEVVGGRLYADNCKFYTFKDPSIVTRGVIDVGGNNSAVDSRTVKAVTFCISNSSVVGVNLGAVSSIFLFRNRGAVVKTNINIDGLDIDANNFGQVLYTELVSGTASSDYIIVDDIVCNVSGKILCNHSGSAYLSFPHRLQSQALRTTITTGVGVNESFGPLTSFFWQYPRLPTVTHGQALSTYQGSVLPISNVNVGNLTNSDIRISVASASGANFTAANNVTVGWRVSMEEI